MRIPRRARSGGRRRADLPRPQPKPMPRPTMRIRRPPRQPGSGRPRDAAPRTTATGQRLWRVAHRGGAPEPETGRALVVACSETENVTGQPRSPDTSRERKFIARENPEWPPTRDRLERSPVHRFGRRQRVVVSNDDVIGHDRSARPFDDFRARASQRACGHVSRTPAADDDAICIQTAPHPWLARCQRQSRSRDRRSGGARRCETRRQSLDRRGSLGVD